MYACESGARLDCFGELVHVESQLHASQVEVEDRGAQDESTHVVDEDLHVRLLHWRRLVVDHVVPAQVQVVELLLLQDLLHEVIHLQRQYVCPRNRKLIQTLVVLHELVDVLIELVVLKRNRVQLELLQSSVGLEGSQDDGHREVGGLYLSEGELL